MRSKTISILSIASLLVFAFVGFADAAVIGSVTISPTSVNQNGTVTISGTCNSSGAVTINLVSGGGSQTAIDTTDASGNFSADVVVNLSGSAAVTATCPSGDTLVGALVIPSIVGSAALTVENNNPAVGNVIVFSGVCGTTAGLAVQISIVRGTVSTVIGNLITDANGSFSAVLTIPDTIGLGPAILQASCPNGTVANVAITLTPDNDTGGAGAGTSPTGGTAAGSGAVAGVSTTPTGGVAAGTGSTASSGFVGWMLLSTIIGLAVYGVFSMRAHSLNS